MSSYHPQEQGIAEKFSAYKNHHLSKIYTSQLDSRRSYYFFIYKGKKESYESLKKVCETREAYEKQLLDEYKRLKAKPS